ncbi:MAG: DUF7676 family protein [Acidimicrobiales bacterium]
MPSSTRGEIRDDNGGTVEVFALPCDAATLQRLLEDCFEEWRHVHFGPLVPGAAWEIAAPQRPSFAMSDGYLTIDFGAWHCHLCTGERDDPAAKAWGARRTGRAELYRRLVDDHPVSWGLRLFNGAGDQQITVLLPNPFITDDQAVRDEADWDRLALWDRLRHRYLEIGPDPLDRSSTGFRH